MKIKRQRVFAEMIVAALTIATLDLAAAAPDSGTSVPHQVVITVEPIHRGNSAAQNLVAADVKLFQGKTPLPVVRLYRLTGDLADMQLFVLLDDSTRGSSLGTQLPELKAFVKSLPATTQVAVGYMHNGTFALQQAFTADHLQAAKALRLPAAIPGVNGSPYFALSDLAKHWPSEYSTGRRAVLMLTDGVDPYSGHGIMDDPYLDTAVQDALKNGVAVYSIYLRGAGSYGRIGWVTNVAKSRLGEVSEETGGYAYNQDFSDPVTIAPFLKDFHDRLQNQYKLMFEALNHHGLQSVKLRTELPGLKIEGPSRIYVR